VCEDCVILLAVFLSFAFVSLEVDTKLLHDC